MGRGLLRIAAILSGLAASLPAAYAEGGRECEAGPVEALAVEVQGATRPFTAVEIVGLQSIAPDALWAAVPRPTAPFAFSEAACFLRDLDALGAFSRIEPTVRVSPSGELSLAVRLEEHPTVRTVVVEGLAEVAEADVVADLVGSPSSPAWFARAEGRGSPGTARGGLPPPDAALRPGLLYGGLDGAVRRAIAGLFDRGYLMARLSGTLSADGTLSVRVDEGRLGELRLVGLDESVRAPALAALDLPPGRTLFAPELADALKRAQVALPFLRPDPGPHPTRALPLVSAAPDGRGGRVFELREAEPAPRPGFFSVQGDRLVLYFDAKTTVRFKVLADEILRHTPVGGAGVGVRVDLRVYDRRNRVHPSFELFSGTVDSGALSAVGASAGEFAQALRFRAPRLWNTELTLETHAMVDTSDAWRIPRQTSYLNSLLFNRPDSEFYWREGGSVGLTVQPAGRLLLGIEHRSDRYASMPSLTNPPSLLNRDEPFVNPPVREGDMGSLLLRAELRSEPFRPEQVRALFRSPETSAVTLPRAFGLRTGYALLATLEVARPGLGSDDGLDFTRFVGDGRVVLATGAESGLKLRTRVGVGSSLPPQKEEALGGWSALRGYDFKELRGGDASWLATAEYRQRWLSGFLDAGGLRQPEGWTGARVGVGLKLHPDSLPRVGRWLRNRRLLPPVELAVAWRLDHPKAEPSLRRVVGSFF